MADKVGLLITTTPGDWQDYVAAFTQEWVTKLKHTNSSIKKLPAGGAHGDAQKVVQAALDFQADPYVKVVVTAGTGAALACKANLTKPFVYAAIGDPALSSLVPGVDGNNFTGGNNRQADQAVVQARVDWMLDHGFQEPFVVLGNNDNGKEPFQTAMTYACDYLTSLGLAAKLQTITPQNDIPTLINSLNSKVLNDAAHDTTNGSPYINTMFEIEDHMTQHGGNAWFGSDFDELFTKAADYASEIMANTGVPAKLPIFISSLSGGGAAHTGKKKGSKKKGSKKKSKAKKKK
jgi:hypothetical protein